MVAYNLHISTLLSALASGGPGPCVHCKFRERCAREEAACLPYLRYAVSGTRLRGKRDPIYSRRLEEIDSDIELYRAVARDST